MPLKHSRNPIVAVFVGYTLNFMAVCMSKIFSFLFVVHICLTSSAGRISGVITDEEGKILPYATVLVKGTTKGTSANNEGNYFINLDPGTYILICQHVGYAKEEKPITVGMSGIVVDFRLKIQQLTLGEVVVKQAEDPAYEIIRNAIKKRKFYQNQLKKFQCEVYTKGQLKLRDFPKRIFGQPVDLETGDTSKRQMIYLSETIATYSVQEPNKSRIEVTSTKVSGETGGFGLSAPQIISFYENNISIGQNLNPRGFVSPIAENALNFYRYKYEGEFFEDGRQISRIKVIPRRKFEPLFFGYINIIENEWRIHSLQLLLTRESQMEFLDTLHIQQLYVPVTNDVWFIKSQVLNPAIKFFGFDAHGSFANIYSKFDLDPLFEKNFFDNTILKYKDSSNKKDSVYWEKTRPVPLLEEEVKDYKNKDSLELLRKDPHYLDSLDRKRNKFSASRFLIFDHTISNQKARSLITVPPLLEQVKYNVVEGWVLNPQFTYFKRIDTGTGRKSFFITPNLRYGFSNQHFNAFVTMNYVYGKKYINAINLSGGKRVFQFNNNSLQGERGATLSALFLERNRRKTYEAWFGRIRYGSALGEGFSWNISLQYQDRMPLRNSTDFTFNDRKNISFTSNYPEEFNGPGFSRHQAAMGSVTISWRPGNKYIEFPGRKISIGSQYPTFSISYTKGLKNFLGSDVDYDKWRLNILDDLNFKLAGRFSYRLSTGGFLNSNKVEIPDYFHSIGNSSVLATSYLEAFQLLPHYKYSNTEDLFSTAFIEHHFNGFLTNKIPGFRQLNWHLVAGSNAFYSDKDLNYFELFAGIENIMRLIRIDFVQGYFDGKPSSSNIRISVRGITGGRAED